MSFNERFFSTFPDQQVTVGVIGRRGPLGMSIDRIQGIQPVTQP